MLLSVLAGFVVAFIAPWIDRAARGATGAVLAIAPLAMFIYFATHIPHIAGGETVRSAVPWAPGLDVDLTFYLDGLSLTFALLITGIGTLIVFYAGSYLEGHRDRGRFFVALLSFMASMLGVVVADNIITLFIFWELTSITSYLLIGFDHHREKARKCALQALIVTGAGGLVLLAGLIMLAVMGGSWELSELLGRGDVVREHGLYFPMLILILIGCFTKSAQWPFHFWLPNAMEAPTPVSAYLHSSTMVKAGVYLLARLNPTVGGTEWWYLLLGIFGGVTMVIGAYLAIRQTQLKKILAYSTISALGVLVFLTGMTAVDDAKLAEYAAKAFGVFLLAHALYKATLFLVAGTLTHETGEKEVTNLGGLRKAMPMTALAGGLAGLSMAGVPPFFGFLGKEYLLETALDQPAWSIVLTGASALAGLFFVIVALLIGFKPFWGAAGKISKHPHEAPAPMWIGPVILATLGLAIGILPNVLGRPLVDPTVHSLLGEPREITLALWHGINPALMISLSVLVAGALAYAALNAIDKVLRPVDLLNHVGPEFWYERLFDGTLAFSRLQTRILQNGYLRIYLLITIVTTIGLVGWSILRFGAIPIPELQPEGGYLAATYENLYHILVCLLVIVATASAVHSRRRLGAIASVGVVGYGVALIYALHGAPDLAITQFIVETLTVILFVFVFYHMPQFPRISRPKERLFHLFVAGVAGLMMSVLVILATQLQVHEKISEYFVAMSVPEGKGRNIVNVILVDFRVLDTLGEIVVLGIAAIGVYALLKLRAERESPKRSTVPEVEQTTPDT